MMKKNSSTSSIKSILKMDDIFNVKFIKLLNGDDLIANIIKKNDDEFIMHDPLTVHVKRAKEGSMVYFIPWLPMEAVSQNQAVINKNQILTMVEPKIKVTSKYLEILKIMSSDILRSEVEEVSEELSNYSYSIN